ncbi:alpha/beta hydrolase [Evansella halocellulosilytica]|uniref:alpha/beta hydrolase n=1 Tax=Evansella halocellulosilytica TaxID=2011013 RepID=UPI000BB8B46F|nr:alpha/beta hydrolase [Evansella halocellulosilytica]
MYRAKVVKLIGLIAIIVTFSLLIIYLFFYLFQNRFLFYPQPITEARVDMINEQYEEVEEIEIGVTEDKTIHGWFINRNDHKVSPPLIIYFGGNAEEVSHLIEDMISLDPYSVILMNYRGYGMSEGSPSEEAMFNDALAIYDYAIENFRIDPSSIAVIGRSMGTGPAVYLSRHRDVKGTVLVSPYDSLTEVAKDRYPLIPVSVLLKHNFNNISKADKITSPLLTMIANDDEVIPPIHSKKLYERWQGHAEKIIFEGKHHNNIQTSDQYWANIKQFLNKLNN